MVNRAHLLSFYLLELTESQTGNQIRTAHYRHSHNFFSRSQCSRCFLMWFSLCLSVILLRSVSCVFTIKIGLDWIGSVCYAAVLLYNTVDDTIQQLSGMSRWSRINGLLKAFLVIAYIWQTVHLQQVTDVECDKSLRPADCGTHNWTVLNWSRRAI